MFCTKGDRLTLWEIKKTAILLQQECSSSSEPWHPRLACYDGIQGQIQLRESRQPNKLFGSRLASTNAEEALVIGMGDASTSQPNSPLCLTRLSIRAALSVKC